MTRLINTAMAALVGMALLGSACQGELKLNHQGNTFEAPPDMAGGGDDGPASTTTIAFSEIQKNMDEAAPSCTGPAKICHGGATPEGELKLKSGASGGIKDNYKELTGVDPDEMPPGTPGLRVDLADPPKSLLMKKVNNAMDASDLEATTHKGGSFCGATDGLGPEICARWLLWIQCGAKFEAVDTTTCTMAGGN